MVEKVSDIIYCDSGAVTLFQATTTTGYNAWAIMAGVPSTAGTATAGSNTTIRQQQSGELYYADSGGPVYGATGLNWSKTPADWAANYFSLSPLTSFPGITATSTSGYDAAGNLTSVVTGATSTTYAYDYLNRLIGERTTGDSATTTFAYDPFGQRVSMTIGSTTTITPNKYYSVISTTVGSTTNATSTEFLYDPGQNGQSDTLMAEVLQKLVNGTATGTPTTYYVHNDNMGNVNVLSDASGTAQQVLSYYPYGSTLVNSGQNLSARKFEGLFNDPSGLIYSNARYLNPSQGQFITEDPLFVNGPRSQNIADPQSLNAYSYAEDNPITKNDPNGQTAVRIGLGAIVWNVAIGAGITIGTTDNGGYSAGPYFDIGPSVGGEVSGPEITTANLPEQYAITTGISASGGDLVNGGVEISKDETYYPYSKKAPETSQEATVGAIGGLGGGGVAEFYYPLATWGNSTNPQASNGPVISSPNWNSINLSSSVNRTSVSTSNVSSGGGGGGGSSYSQTLNSLASALQQLSSVLSSLSASQSSSHK